MPTPNDIHILAWLMIPLVTASWAITIKKSIKQFTFARSLMLAVCFFVLVSQVALVLIFGGYKGIKVSTWIFLGGTSMHCARWLTRIYVCLRMIKLSPSPMMSTLFTNLAFISVGLAIMVISNFICYTWEWYETHTTAAPVLRKNLMSIVGIVLSISLFDIASVYLHVKSLMKFGLTGVTGIKLYVISISTLGSIVFALGHTYGQITEDSKLELFFVGLELAMLPSSIVLGELVAVHIGRKYHNLTSSKNSGKNSATHSTSKNEAGAGKRITVAKSSVTGFDSSTRV